MATSLGKDTIARLIQEERSAMWRTLLQFGGLLIVPFLAIFLLSGLVILREVRELTTIRTTTEVLQIVQRTSALVTQLQKERGMSAGFVGSSAGQFRDELADQRALTDLAIGEEFSEARGELLAELYPPLRKITQARLDAVGAQLDGLKEMRAGVDSLDVAVGDVLAYYTPIIEALIDIGGIKTGLSARSVENTPFAFQSLSIGIEMAGRERAAGAVGFGQGQFNMATIERFARLQANHDQNLDQFRKNVAPRDCR